MTKKQFWQSAMNWGLITGLALFVISIISWLLKFETNKMGWAEEVLQFMVICPIILYTGRRNARLSGPEGYPYSRAVGWIFAMLMFTGIVYGVGEFLLTNFIARDYYDAIMQTGLAEFEGTPQYDMMVSMFRWMTNPIVLVILSIIEMVIKGGLLGLILTVFFKKNPDIFASAAASDASASQAQGEDNSNE